MAIIDVFVADDDPKAVRYYQAIVNKMDGMRSIGSTSNGKVLVDIVLTVRPAVVLLDHKMNPDGFELATTLHKKLPALPIILLGGREDLSEKAREVGAYAYLSFPIIPSKLVETIRKAYEHSQIPPG
jgi:DNA-binding NarL/FixJ family response regulator